MSWMLTANGREHEFNGLRWPRFDLEDIAHHLALINRFNGATNRPYSVAEHSLLVADLAAAEGASPAVQLAALMHDAHEAYCGDVTSPVQRMLGPRWRAFEDNEAHLLRRQYGLVSTFAAHQSSITRWDLTALATERRDLTSYSHEAHAPWHVLDSPGAEVAPSGTHDLNCVGRANVGWRQWRLLFAGRAMELMNSIASQALDLRAGDRA